MYKCIYNNIVGVFVVYGLKQLKYPLHRKIILPASHLIANSRHLSAWQASVDGSPTCCSEELGYDVIEELWGWLLKNQVIHPAHVCQHGSRSRVVGRKIQQSLSVPKEYLPSKIKEGIGLEKINEVVIRLSLKPFRGLLSLTCQFPCPNLKEVPLLSLRPRAFLFFSLLPLLRIWGSIHIPVLKFLVISEKGPCVSLSHGLVCTGEGSGFSLHRSLLSTVKSTVGLHRQTKCCKTKASHVCMWLLRSPFSFNASPELPLNSPLTLPRNRGVPS